MSNTRPTVSIKGRRGTRLVLSWRAAAASPGAAHPALPASTVPRTFHARGKRDGCYRLFHVAEIPVKLHWSALTLFAALTAASAWVGAALALLAIGIFVVMLVHELGHAFLARRMGYQVLEIRLFPFHGQCRYHQPYSAFEDAVIAWGGVAAQSLLLLPATATLVLLGNTAYGPLNLLLVVFSYFNACIMIFNLMPTRAMDGDKAWRLPLMIARAKWTMRELRRNKVLL
jgi:Zn-dependent protease